MPMNANAAGDTATDQNNVHTAPLNYETQVLYRYDGIHPLLPEFEPYADANLHVWWWYCSQCLKKKVWADFDRHERTKWPYEVCRQCTEELNSIVKCKRGRLSRAASKASRKRAIASMHHLKRGGKPPRALEALAQAILTEVGGVNGAASMVKSLLNSPAWHPRHMRNRAIIYALLVHSLEASVALDLEERRIVASQESLKHKSLSQFSSEDLKEALGPMVLETLRKRPEVGIKALQQAGYVVARSARDLARAVKKKDERYQRQVLRELMK